MLDEELGAKQARIAAIQARGDEPLVEFARRQIDHAEEAYLVEAALIDVLRRHGSPSLANQVRGHGADLGLITLAELQEQSATPPLETPLKAILIKLGWWTDEDDRELPRKGYGFKRGMSDAALYDSTRAWWRSSRSNAGSYPYADAVFQGVTRGAWEIDHEEWRRHESEGPYHGRWAFEGVGPFSAVKRHMRRLPARTVDGCRGERGDGRAVFGSGQSIAYWA